MESDLENQCAIRNNLFWGQKYGLFVLAHDGNETGFTFHATDYDGFLRRF